MELYEQWLRAEIARPSLAKVEDPGDNAVFNPHLSLSYQALHEGDIRLLRLCVGQDNEPIAAALEVHGLNEANKPNFIAISYTWNRSSETREVTIDEQRVHVGFNCWFALQQARQHMIKEHHWIDSICINQQDMHEKATQVGQMKQIYAQADHILACLGPHADYSDMLLTRMHHLNADWLASIGGDQWAPFVTQFDSWLPDALSPLKVPPDFPILAWAACRLAQRRYWSRSWIVQELTLAKHVLLCIGDNWIEMEHFQVLIKALRYLAHDQMDLSFLSNNTLLAADGRLSRVPWLVENRLLDLILKYATTECSVPHDHVFALLGLTTDDDAAQVDLDYTRSPLDLAMQVLTASAASYSLLQAEALLKSLQIDCTHPIVSTWITERQDLFTAGPQLSASQNSTLLGPLSRSPKLNKRGIRISLDAWGRLSIPLEFARDPSYAGRSIEGFAAAFDKVRQASISSAKKARKSAVPIYIGQDVEVLACHSTQEGDVLLIDDYGSPSPDLGLIIRQEKDNLYSIIGQAIINDGLQRQWDHLTKYYLDRHTYSIHFDQEDMIALLAQGLAAGRQTWTDLHFQRLGVAVCGRHMSSYVVRHLSLTGTGRRDKEKNAGILAQKRYAAGVARGDIIVIPRRESQDSLS